MCLQIGFVIFWRKDFGTKAAHKVLVKLTPVPLHSTLGNARSLPLECSSVKYSIMDKLGGGGGGG
jgi:hypothetical protein